MTQSYMQMAEILLVEDDPGDIRLTKEALKSNQIGNNLHVVEDGEEALDFLYRRGKYVGAPRPDLILLDLNLPRVNGQEVLGKIKHDSDLRLIPVVVLTTSTHEQDILKAYDLNANCYITKPLDWTQFVDVVRQIDNFWLGVVKLPLQK